MPLSPGGVTSKNYDYDYDSIEPFLCFDNADEDFYRQRSLLQPPTPGEDIWKKLERLRTPPRSPSCRHSFRGACVCASPTERLETVSELLGDDAVNQSFICDADSSHSLLRSSVIQDCMWSGFSGRLALLHRGRKERSREVRAPRSCPADPCAACARRPLETPRCVATDTPPNSAGSGSDSGTWSCFVFIYVRLREQCRKYRRRFGCSHVILVHAEDEDEENDEIDVVTVEKRQVAASELSEVATHLRQSAPIPKRSNAPIHQHNYAAHPSSRCEQRAAKRLKLEKDCSGLGQISSSTKCVSPLTSAMEDSDKRRTHNVLERQRRNELKLSFFALRDEIPEVAHNEKASKVLILKKATEFIFSMKSHEERLVLVKEQLKRKGQRLKYRLEQLKKQI
ncbi:transcriptional regulator Myc-1-like [Scleropages formosus]|uniref:transcriptional regulator Myc-1-like n=1 Tax=Scleropages formosus TaxID=113540 RepID=UPI0010FA6841|nr:transcriptional regulator Myc-1-like [Scleropages formosus]